MTNEHTFIKVSNSDVYTKLLEIESKINIYSGRIKLNTWIATTALMIVLGVMTRLIL